MTVKDLHLSEEEMQRIIDGARFAFDDTAGTQVNYPHAKPFAKEQPPPEPYGNKKRL